MYGRAPTVASTPRRDAFSHPASALPLFLLGLTLAGTCQAQKYTVTKLPTLPGGTYTAAVSMNNAGVVAGNADDSNGDAVAVKWNNASPSIVFFDSFPGATAGAVAINNQNVVIGDAFDTESGAFEIGPAINVEQFYDHGITTGAINDANVIVGEIQGHPALWDGVDISQSPQFLPTTADADGALPTGINSAGIIVGIEDDFLPDFSDTYPVAVRWKPDPTTHAPGATVKALGGLGGTTSGATAVNVNGWVVGWATLGNKLQHAVVWEGNSGAFDLGTLGGKQSAAGGVNAEGDIAGDAQTAAGAWHAVLWTHKHFTAIDLNAEIGSSMAKQITLTSAADTNDRCMVLANGVDNKTGAQESFVLSLTDQSQCNEP